MYEMFLNRAKYLYDAFDAEILFYDELNDDEVVSSNYNGEGNPFEDDFMMAIGFICPDCDEVIYFQDWEDNFEKTENWMICPICGFEGEEYDG